MDVGHDTASRDGGLANVLIELFIILDGQLQMTWDNAVLLVVLGGDCFLLVKMPTLKRDSPVSTCFLACGIYGRNFGKLTLVLPCLLMENDCKNLSAGRDD